MCGRYTLVAGQAEIHERFGVEVGPKTPTLTPRCNVAPTLVDKAGNEGPELLAA